MKEKKDYRKLVGYIESPIKVPSSFAIPIYKNDGGYFEHHKIDDAIKTIVGFTALLKKPPRVVELPNSMQREVSVGDPALFVINTTNLLFVGTADDLRPHFEGIKKVAGEHFIEELELIKCLYDVDLKS